jgi:hypothetical protein
MLRPASEPKSFKSVKAAKDHQLGAYNRGTKTQRNQVYGHFLYYLLRGWCSQAMHHW